MTAGLTRYPSKSSGTPSSTFSSVNLRFDGSPFPAAAALDDLAFSGAEIVAWVEAVVGGEMDVGVGGNWDGGSATGGKCDPGCGMNGGGWGIPGTGICGCAEAFPGGMGAGGPRRSGWPGKLGGIGIGLAGMPGCKPGKEGPGWPALGGENLADVSVADILGPPAAKLDEGVE